MQIKIEETVVRKTIVKIPKSVLLEILRERTPAKIPSDKQVELAYGNALLLITYEEEQRSTTPHSPRHTNLQTDQVSLPEETYDDIDEPTQGQEIPWEPPSGPMHPGTWLMGYIEQHGISPITISNEARIPITVLQDILHAKRLPTEPEVLKLANWTGSTPAFFSSMIAQYKADGYVE